MFFKSCTICPLICVSGTLTDILQEVQIPIVSINDCYNAFAAITTITSNMICAGVLNGGGKNSWQVRHPVVHFNPFFKAITKH